MVDYFVVYNFKMWWMSTYGGMGNYYSEYGTLVNIVENDNGVTSYFFPD